MKLSEQKTIVKILEQSIKICEILVKTKKISPSPEKIISKSKNISYKVEKSGDLYQILKFQKISVG